MELDSSHASLIRVLSLPHTFRLNRRSRSFSTMLFPLCLDSLLSHRPLTSEDTSIWIFMSTFDRRVNKMVTRIGEIRLPNSLRLRLLHISMPHPLYLLTVTCTQQKEKTVLEVRFPTQTNNNQKNQSDSPSQGTPFKDLSPDHHLGFEPRCVSSFARKESKIPLELDLHTSRGTILESRPG
jgi:hypothetical protein